VSSGIFDFTIVMPSYQQAAYLPTALASLEAQCPASFELIVQDGGSTDGSVEILREFAARAPFPMQWESGPDGGQAAALNRGIRKARGAFLGCVNSDDLLRPGALQAVAETFTAHPEADVVYGRAAFLDPKGLPLGEHPLGEWSLESLLERCGISQPACFWRRSLVERVGLFDETLHGSFDYDYWLRAAPCARAVFVDRVLAAAHCHDAAKTFRDRRRLLEESCLLQARHGGGKISPGNAHELASLQAGGHLLRPWPHWLLRVVFEARFYVHMAALAPRTRGFPGKAYWRRFPADFSNSLKLARQPLARVAAP
jgi:glycosyltransferase involved in cell wall biosynthesis